MDGYTANLQWINNEFHFTCLMENVGNIFNLEKEYHLI